MTLEARLILLAQAIGTDVKTLTTAQGTLASLTTTEQSNLVGAINEMNAAFAARLNDGSATTSTTEVWSANKITEYIAANAANITSGSDPVAANDTASGYHVGQAWVNSTSKRTWILVDGATGAAVWSERAELDDTSATNSTTQSWSANKITAVVEAAKTAVTDSILDGAGVALDTLNELAAALGDDANFATTMTTALAARLRFDAAQSLTAPEKVQANANLGSVSLVQLGDPDSDFATTYATAKA